MKKINLKLNHYQYTELTRLVEYVVDSDKWQDNALVQLVIAEFYYSKIKWFNFWKPSKGGTMPLTLNPSEAVALHTALEKNEFYNIHMRMDIEPIIINFLN